MFIVKTEINSTPINVHVYYYKGGETGEWSADVADAKEYATTPEIPADLALTKNVYSRYRANSQVEAV